MLRLNKLFCFLTKQKTDYLERAAVLQGSLVGAVLVPKIFTWKEKADEIYKVMSILDSKASALMRFSSVLLAAATFLLKKTTDPKVPDPLAGIDLGAQDFKWVALFLFLSIIFCIPVIGVDWKFLGYIDLANKDAAAEINNLQITFQARQRYYQISWFLTLISIFLLFYLVFLRGFCG